MLALDEPLDFHVSAVAAGIEQRVMELAHRRQMPIILGIAPDLNAKSVLNPIQIPLQQQ